MVDERWRAANEEAPENMAADWPHRHRRHSSPRLPIGPVVVFPDPGERDPVLPTPASRLVGRAEELTFLNTLIADPDVRLITLTGPGGTGKTHLVLVAAAAMREHFPDGTRFVDLAAIVRPAHVLPAIAEALGLRERVGEDRGRQLQAFLRPRRILLVLDNFEQVLKAAPKVRQILTEAPGVTVVVTSRAPLRLAGEREVQVPPLPLPDADAGPNEVMASDAGRLFVERVQSHNPAFVVDADAASLITEICARLDGLPLAIELAAARANVLSLQQVRDRLDRRLQLLTHGTRDAPPRQNTMRDAIAWSYDLLAAEEQALFRQLAVFAGGFTLEAAEYVGRGRKSTALGRKRGEPEAHVALLPSEASRSPAPPERSAPPVVLDLISSLVDHSLLVRTTGIDGLPRFRMLDTIREFGLERLKPDEEVTIRAAHAQYMLNLTQTLQRLIRTQSTSGPLTRLAAEEVNLRAAYDWLEERGPAEDFAAIVAASYTFWYALGRIRDVTAALERALSNRDEVSAAERARLLIGNGELLMGHGDVVRAAEVLAESLPFIRAEGDAFDVALALIAYGASLNFAGKYTEGGAFLMEALAVAETLEDGTLRSAMAGRALANLGVTERGLGNLELAEARCEEALRRYHGLGLDMAETRARMDVADITIDQGDCQLAAERYLACIEQMGERGDMRLVADAFAGIGRAAIIWGQPRPAALLMAAAEALRERVGTAILLPLDRDMHERNRAALRSALGEESFATTWTEGRRFSLSQAVATAKAVTPTDAPVAPAPGSPDRGLSRRQVEVLQLMARWKTDREIAEALCMSPRTASWHVRIILEKLGTSSRRDAVARARAEGLI